MATVTWTVLLHGEFLDEAETFPSEARVRLDALAEVLRVLGPELGRPRCDTLKGSRYANMKNCGSTRQMEFGGWRLRLIRRAARSCWWAAINRGSVPTAFRRC